MTETLVLLAGTMCDARLFAPQIVGLSADHTIHLAPLTGADTVGGLADQVLAGAPQRFALAGHSLGGMVALEIQRRAPERVTRLAVLDTNAQGETPSLAAARETQIVRVRAGLLDQVVREEIDGDLAHQSPRRAEIQDMVVRMALDLGPEIYVRQARALQRRPDQQKTLRKLKIPTLIMCGEHDRLTPLRRHDFMAALAHGSRLEVIKDAGHLPSLEQPEQVTALLRDWMGAPLVLR
jgi:pimeloyl-ACP methyl ester carboxylesterase